MPTHSFIPQIHRATLLCQALLLLIRRQWVLNGLRSSHIRKHTHIHTLIPVYWTFSDIPIPRISFHYFYLPVLFLLWLSSDSISGTGSYSAPLCLGRISTGLKGPSSIHYAILDASLGVSGLQLCNETKRFEFESVMILLSKYRARITKYSITKYSQWVLFPHFYTPLWKELNFKTSRLSN